MDSMLQQLAYYKRHDPAVAEEVEKNNFPLCQYGGADNKIK